MVDKKVTPAGLGTFPTNGSLFVGLLVAVILIVGALTFFPALSLGPSSSISRPEPGGCSDGTQGETSFVVRSTILRPAIVDSFRSWLRSWWPRTRSCSWSSG